MTRVAIITGASSGIGQALAVLLAQEGFAVVLAGRRRDKLEDGAARIRATGGTVLPIVCDVTQRDEAEALIDRTVRAFGRLDILVNNAGRGHFTSVEDTTDGMLENMFAVNVYALWHTTRPALRQMRQQGSGHIINIASIAGKLGFAFNSAYVAAKHACVGFTHALRMELVETGIHATVVCPAGVLTEWAQSTEGGSMLPLFEEAGPISLRIARERGITPPPIEGPVNPDVVARQILACIRNPVAEVYTHSGLKQFVVLSAQDREQAERHQLPGALAEREVYERLKRDGSAQGGR